MEQDFHGDLQVNLAWFLPFSPVSLTELCSFWYGLKDLFILHKLAGKVGLDHVTGGSGANGLIHVPRRFFNERLKEA